MRKRHISSAQDCLYKMISHSMLVLSTLLMLLTQAYCIRIHSHNHYIPQAYGDVDYMKVYNDVKDSCNWSQPKDAKLTLLNVERKNDRQRKFLRFFR